MGKTVKLETQRTHDCPVCDGVMPADAVTVTAWRFDLRSRDLVERRTVSMRCPHCGHTDARSETRPVPHW